MIKTAALVLLIMLSHYGWAEDKMTLVTEHWPPFNFINANGEVDGIATDVMKQVLHEAGLDYEIELLAWKRAYKKAKENKNVLLYTVYKLKPRQNDFQWICPLINTPGVAVYSLSTRDDIKINDIEELKRYSIGTINTGWTLEYLKYNGFIPGHHLDLSREESANLRKLLSGRIDLVVQEKELIDLRLINLGGHSSLVKQVFTLLTDEHKEGCMATSHKTPTYVVNRLRQALIKVRENQIK